MQFVKVFLRRALPKFDRVYTYKVKEEDKAEAVLGRRVLIPFGRSNRLDEAFIYSYLDADELKDLDKSKIKPIAAILDDYPLLDQNQLKLIFQMKQRYTCTYGQAANCILPSGFNLQLAELITLTEKGLNNLDSEFLKDFYELADLDEDSSKDEKLKAEVELDDFLLKSYRRKDLFNLAKQGLIDIEAVSNQKIKRKTEEYCSLTDREAASILLSEHSLGSLQQELAVEYLLQEGEALVYEVLQACDINRGSLKTLEKKGLLEFHYEKLDVDAIELKTMDESLIPHNLKKVKDEDLKQEQVEAIKRIGEALEKNLRTEFLLHGITGSGKTEVYIRLCKEALKQDKSCIILVPEIGLTPQILAQFELHFPEQITVLHSGLGQRERFDRWEKIKAGEFPIVIGARSAVFAPLKNLGLIIIDEEQEDTYKSDMSPYYDARTIARLRSLNENTVLVLGSATPSLDTYYRAKTNKSELITLHERIGNASLASAEIIDLRSNWNTDTEGILSQVLIDAINESLAKKQKAMIFLNRRGFARTCLCKNCGERLECPNCSVGFTYHKDKHLLVCHYCGTSMKIPDKCPNCHKDALILYGFGTQRVEELCKEIFDVPVYRLDQDTSRNAKNQARILQEFRESESAILVGTQMIAKGHNFPRLSLVAVLSTDQMISRNDFRASEKAFQLITQAAGRAGRSELKGKVYIQAFDVDNYAVRYSAKQDYELFSQEELAFRKMLHYPPYSNLAYISISSNFENKTKYEAKKLYKLLKSLSKEKPWSNVLVLKPAPAKLYKLQGRYRYSIVLKAEGENKVKSLSTLWQQISVRYNPKDVRLSFRLDPA